MASAPDLNIAEAQRFLCILADAEPVTFQTFDDDKQCKKKALARILHGDPDEHADELMRLNNAGAGVFVMVNAGDGKRRAAANVTRVRAVFVDLDGASVAPVLGCHLEPHIAVESSPGRWHAYWLQRDCRSSSSAPCRKPSPLASTATHRYTICPASCACRGSFIAKTSRSARALFTRAEAFRTPRADPWGVPAARRSP